MNLQYSEKYQEFRREVRAFLAANWSDEDANSGPPQNATAAAFGAITRTDARATEFRLAAIDRGYLYRHIPRRYGGSEQPVDALATTIIHEEFRRARAPHELMGQGPSMLAPTLVEHGTEEQRERFIRATLLGHIRWCQGYSEPGAGSDLASLRARAELDGDFWVVNGHKIWTSNAEDADWMFCLVRTEPAAPKHDGISYLLIDMKSPGIEVRPLRQMTGDADFNEVFLENVRVPVANLVGNRGEGWRVSRSTLKHERAMIGNAAFSRRTLDGVTFIAHAIQTRDRLAIEDPVLRDAIVRAEAKLLASEYHGLRLLTLQARGRDAGAAAMVTKLYSTHLSYEIGKLAMDVLGDRGIFAPGEKAAPGDGLFLNAYMWSLGVLIAGGTANIQRNVIGERALGLPRDAAASRR